MAGGHLISVGEARGLLGISKEKMAKLIADGVLPAIPNPLDARGKLVWQADVERLSGAGRVRQRRRPKRKDLPSSTADQDG